MHGVPTVQLQFQKVQITIRTLLRDHMSPDLPDLRQEVELLESFSDK